MISAEFENDSKFDSVNLFAVVVIKKLDFDEKENHLGLKHEAASFQKSGIMFCFKLYSSVHTICF